MYYDLMHSLSPISHFYLKISFYERNTMSMSANVQHTLCWDAWFSVGAGLHPDSQKAPPHSPVPLSLPSFHSASHRATVRPPTRPYGFYHLSTELSLVKAFSTWVFGTHSKSLSRHLDSFSILHNWPPFFFFPTGGPARGRQKTGSSFWLLFHLWPWMPPSLTVPPLFANHCG